MGLAPARHSFPNPFLRPFTRCPGSMQVGPADSLHKVSGCGGRLRTGDIQGMNLALYLAELHRAVEV